LNDDYVELVLLWGAEGERPRVRTWLEAHGLATMKVTRGLLVTGTRARIEAVFSVSLQNPSLPFELPIPADLTGDVASIVLPKPRSYQR
jgi:hypothetical protein